MFWGVTILGGRRYTQTVERSYHISKAALEVSIDSKDLNKKRVQLMLEQNKSHFLLCNLDSGKNIQVDLDLIFTEGEEVTFYLNGQGTVHLTGYVLDFEDVDDYDDLDEESEEESEDEEVTNENEKRILKGGYPNDSKKSKVESVNGLDDGEDDEDLLGSLDPGSDEDDDEEEEDEDEDEEEDVPILQKAKPAQKQVNGQVPKLQQQQQKLTPAKGQQNQKNVGSAGKQNNQGGQQNKFGQKGQNSPQGQKPNQNQKGGNQQQQQKGQANQNKQQLNNNKAKGPFTPDQKASNKFNKQHNKMRKSFA